MDAQPQIRSYTEQAEGLGRVVREKRRRAKTDLAAAEASAAGSRLDDLEIENGQLSPSYEEHPAPSDGLKVDVVELFSRRQRDVASGRGSITRRGAGVIHRSRIRYEMLATDSRASSHPARDAGSPRAASASSELPRHEGEEFIYVVSGIVELHSEHYAPHVSASATALFPTA